MSNDTIDVFGIKYKKDDLDLKISRERYAIIDKKNHFQKNDQYLLSHGWHLRDKNKYDDSEYTYYSDEYCIKHQNDCLYNYDLNMAFFEKLDENEFNKVVNKIFNKFKNIYEINNLNEVNNISGVYILVLQEYKQIYVGESINVGRRIKQHWNRKKQFDRLIFGKIDDSILSIDSFGPLDTKRIFVYESKYDRQEIEEKIVKYIPKYFLINRTRGGSRGFDLESMKLDTIANRNKRNLK